MKHLLSALALAAVGTLALSAADATPTHPGLRYVAAGMGSGPGFEPQTGPRDVIEPPSSIDPGMTLDPPQVGTIRIVPPPAAAPSGRPILPR
jgi:hypothetical protein